MYDRLFQYFQGKTSIDHSAFDHITPYFKLRKAQRNEIMLAQGDPCNFFLFVNKGCARMYTLNEDGSEHTRYFAFEGKFVTALTSLINQEPSFENIQAVEKSEFLMISRDDFFTLVNSVKEVNFVYRDILEMAYITSQKRIYGLQGDSALDRLKWLMEYQPRILARLSNKVVASYLGVTPFTLSRLKSEL